MGDFLAPSYSSGPRSTLIPALDRGRFVMLEQLPPVFPTLIRGPRELPCSGARASGAGAPDFQTLLVLLTPFSAEVLPCGSADLLTGSDSIDHPWTRPPLSTSS